MTERRSKTQMAKTKPGKKDLESYTIKGTNKVVKGIFQEQNPIFVVTCMCSPY